MLGRGSPVAVGEGWLLVAAGPRVFLPSFTIGGGGGAWWVFEVIHGLQKVSYRGRVLRMNFRLTLTDFQACPQRLSRAAGRSRKQYGTLEKPAGVCSPELPVELGPVKRRGHRTPDADLQGEGRWNDQTVCRVRVRGQ